MTTREDATIKCDLCNRATNYFALAFDLSVLGSSRNESIQYQTEVIKRYGRDKFYCCYLCCLEKLGFKELEK